MTKIHLVRCTLSRHVHAPGHTQSPSRCRSRQARPCSAGRARSTRSAHSLCVRCQRSRQNRATSPAIKASAPVVAQVKRVQYIARVKCVHSHSWTCGMCVCMPPLCVKVCACTCADVRKWCMYNTVMMHCCAWVFVHVRL